MHTVNTPLLLKNSAVNMKHVPNHFLCLMHTGHLPSSSESLFSWQEKSSLINAPKAVFYKCV